MRIGKVIDWDGHRGVAGCDPRDWVGKLMRPFWLDDACLVATSVDNHGRLALEFLLTVLQRHYMLGLTAMTWPTHDGPSMLSDSHVNDPPGTLLITQPSYEELCAPSPKWEGYWLVFGEAWR